MLRRNHNECKLTFCQRTWQWGYRRPAVVILNSTIGMGGESESRSHVVRTRIRSGESILRWHPLLLCIFRCRAFHRCIPIRHFLSCVSILGFSFFLYFNSRFLCPCNLVCHFRSYVWWSSIFIAKVMSWFLRALIDILYSSFIQQNL